MIPTISTRNFRDDPYNGNKLIRGSIRLARIFKLERDDKGLTGRCSVIFLDSLEQADRVLLPFGDIGNAGFSGSVPEPDGEAISAKGKGTVCVVAGLTTGENVILTYIHPRTELLRDLGQFNLKDGEKEIRSKTRTGIKWDEYGNLIVKVRDKSEKEDNLQVFLGKVRDSNGETIKDSETNNSITCQIKTKKGLEINIDSEGNIHALGIDKYVTELVEKHLKGETLILDLIDKLQITATSANIDCPSVTVNGGIAGVHSAVNHPVCYFLGQPLTGSTQVKILD